MKAATRLIGIFCIFAMFAAISRAASPLTYQGRIVRPDGSPLEAPSVTMTVQIASPGAEDCLLFQETHTLNMTGTNGVFSLSIGNGTRASSSIDGGFTLSQIFSNKSTSLSPLPTCASGNSYSPVATDSRRLKISFNDGSGVQTVQTQSMSSVPYAFEATQVGGYDPSHLLRVDGATVPAFTPSEFTELQNLLGGASAQYTKANELGGSPLPSLNGGDSLRWNGTAWESYSASTVVSSITAGTGLNVGAGPGGTISSSGTLNLANTAVNPGSYGTVTDIPQIQVDAQGRITSATNIPLTTVANFSGSLTGDVSGTQSATSVDKIKGVAVSAIPPTSGQILRHDGAQWIGATPNFADLKNAANAAQFPTNCDSTQTLTYDAVNDQFMCTAITVSAFGGTLAGDVTGAQSSTVVAGVGGVAAANVASGANLANAATDANTASTIVRRDASGNFSAGQITATMFVGNLSGIAYDTTHIQGQPVDATAPTTGGQSLRWDGTKYMQTNLTFQDLKNAAGVAQIPTTCTSSETLTYDAVNDKMICTAITVTAFSGALAGDVTGSQSSTVVASVGGVGAANVASGANLANAAVSANTASTIVRRDISGNFSAGQITATTFVGALTGTATNTTQIQGQPVDATAPTAAGQLLRWDGSQYAVTNLKFQDLKTSASLTQFPTNCSTTQVMIYSAVTDAYECQNISLVNTTSIMGGDVTGSVATNTVTKIQNRDVAATAPSAGQVFKWNGSAWAPSAELWAPTGSDISFATGKVGIGTTTPANALDVQGSIRARIYDNGSSRTIDWSLGNVQYTTAGCDGTNFTMTNLLDGGSYTLILKAASHTGACAFTGSSVSNWRFRPTAYQPSGYVVFTFLKAGTDVFIAWSDSY